MHDLFFLFFCLLFSIRIYSFVLFWLKQTCILCVHLLCVCFFFIPSSVLLSSLAKFTKLINGCLARTCTHTLTYAVTCFFSSHLPIFHVGYIFFFFHYVYGECTNEWFSNLVMAVFFLLWLLLLHCCLPCVVRVHFRRFLIFFFYFCGHAFPSLVYDLIVFEAWFFFSIIIFVAYWTNTAKFMATVIFKVIN